MKLSDIPTRFQTPFAVSATSSYIRTIPQTTVDPDAASMALGWPPNTGTPVGAGGSPPDIRDANGILNIITQWSRWLNAGGQVGYDATFSSAIGGYPKEAILAAATLGCFWYSTVDDNTSDPDTGGANWVGFSPLPMNGTDTGTANAAVVTLKATFASLSALTGIPISIKKSGSANTGAMTVDLKNSDATDLGTLSVVHADGSALLSGELPASAYFVVIYDGSVLQLQSPSVTLPQLQKQATNYAADTGTTNAIVVALTPPTTTRITNAPIRVKVLNTNTGPVTANYGAGALSVRKRTAFGLQALSGHELIVGQTYEFIDDGTYLQFSPIPTQPNIFFSGQQSFTNGSTIGPFSISGYVNNVTEVRGILVCQSSDTGFPTGAIVNLPVGSGDDGTGCNAYVDGTNAYCVISTNGIELYNPSTHLRAAITPGNWKINLIVEGTN